MFEKLFGKKWEKRILILFLEITVAIVINSVVYTNLSNRLNSLQQITKSFAMEKAESKLKQTVDGIIKNLEYIKKDLVTEKKDDMELLLNGLIPIISNDTNWQNIIEKILMNSNIKVQVTDKKGSFVFNSSDSDVIGSSYEVSVTRQTDKYNVFCFQTDDYIDNRIKTNIHNQINSKIYFNDEYVWIKKIITKNNNEINYLIIEVNPENEEEEGKIIFTEAKYNYPYEKEINLIREKKDGIFFNYIPYNSQEKYYVFSQLYAPYNWIISAGIPEKNFYGEDIQLKIENDINITNIMYFLGSFSLLSIIFTGYAMTRNHMKEELEKEILKNDIQSTFLSQVSHDLRTPLNAIIGLTDLTLKDYKDSQKVYSNLRIIKNSSHHLSGIINDLIALNSDNKTANIETNIEIDKLLDAVLFTHKFDLENRKQRIITKTNVFHKEFYGNRNKIVRILENILGNASKYSPTGGKIKFQVTETEDNSYFYTFKIIDFGTGIAKQDLENIYKPFYRSQTSRLSNISGSGLGLALVERLIKEIDGKISIESSLGKGTIVEVSLQLNKPKEYENKIVIKDDQLKNTKILLAEDNEINILTEKKILEKFGAEVTVARDGQECIDIFLKNPPNTFDIILMDILMPNVSGIEASKYIRKSQHPQSKTIKIISISANASPNDIKESLNAGINAHTSKPINIEILISTISKFLKE